MYTYKALFFTIRLPQNQNKIQPYFFPFSCWSITENIHRKNHTMYCCWENENIWIPHINSNVFMPYLTVFTKITSYKPVSQL